MTVPEYVEGGLVERLRAHDPPPALLELDEQGLLDVERAPVRPTAESAVHSHEMVVVRHRPGSSTR